MASEDIAGVGLSVESVGEGTPCLIFVHGFGCAGEDWRRQIEALSPRFRCVTFDLPGHGRSDLSPSGDVQELGRVLCEVKQRYGQGRAVLIGHSLGCRVILNAMSLDPEGVVGLVMVEQNLVSGRDAEAAASALRRKLSEVGFRAFIRPAFEAMFSTSSEPAVREHVLARLDRLDLHFAEELLISSVRWEAETSAQLARLRVPVLLLQSTYLDEQFQWHPLTPGMTTPWTEAVTRGVREAKLEVIPGAGHFLQLEAAASVNACIGAFAERWRVPAEHSSQRGQTRERS